MSEETELHVLPIRAFEVKTGDVLCGMNGPMPRACLVTRVFRADEDTVTLSVLDCLAGPVTDGETNSGEITYDAIDVLARFEQVAP
jgi:hypothetical protein